MRSRSTVEFLGIWEELNNAEFNRVDFEAVKLAGKIKKQPPHHAGTWQDGIKLISYADDFVSSGKYIKSDPLGLVAE